MYKVWCACICILYSLISRIHQIIPFPRFLYTVLHVIGYICTYIYFRLWKNVTSKYFLFNTKNTGTIIYFFLNGKITWRYYLCVIYFLSKIINIICHDVESKTIFLAFVLTTYIFILNINNVRVWNINELLCFRIDPKLQRGMEFIFCLKLQVNKSRSTPKNKR